MTNPWLRLPNDAPFVLPEDARGAAQHSLRLPPSPWSGAINRAPVIALLKSPGDSEQDYLDIQNPEFVRVTLGQLTGDAPFPWHLERWSDTGAGLYWRPRLMSLAQATSDETVSERFAVAQLFPYHSKSWQEP